MKMEQGHEHREVSYMERGGRGVHTSVENELSLREESVEALAKYGQGLF